MPPALISHLLVAQQTLNAWLMHANVPRTDDCRLQIAAFSSVDIFCCSKQRQLSRLLNTFGYHWLPDILLSLGLRLYSVPSAQRIVSGSIMHVGATFIANLNQFNITRRLHILFKPQSSLVSVHGWSCQQLCFFSCFCTVTYTLRLHQSTRFFEED